MLLGKGITFDTGGINLKPYESFVSTMKNDMAGAALAFQLFRALVEADHPEPVVLVIPTQPTLLISPLTAMVVDTWVK